MPRHLCFETPLKKDTMPPTFSQKICPMFLQVLDKSGSFHQFSKRSYPLSGNRIGNLRLAAIDGVDVHVQSLQVLVSGEVWYVGLGMTRASSLEFPFVITCVV
jgi:hypothetical protein